MAAAVPALMFVSAAAAVAGTVVSTVGQLQQAEQNAQAAQAQGDAAAQASEANARIAAQQAETARGQASQERRRSVIEAEVFSREARRRQGTRVSAIGASGFQLSGSALDVIHDASLSDAQQRLFTLSEGEERARARLAGATIEDMSAIEFQRRAAEERRVGGQLAGASRTAGRFGAAGTILGGASGVGLTLAQSPTFRRLGQSRGQRITPIPNVRP